MNGRLGLLFLTACALLQSAGCSGDRAGFTAKDRSQFAPISKGINRASSFKLYEGLPHQGWERDEFQRELEKKKTVTLHGFPFYERPLPVAAADVETLRRLSSASGSFHSYAGAKNCGGYHPDYCLSWKDGEASYELLICFGCHEMKLYGPRQELLADIQRDVAIQFETTLKKYRDQRPQAK